MWVLMYSIFGEGYIPRNNTQIQMETSIWDIVITRLQNNTVTAYQYKFFYARWSYVKSLYVKDYHHHVWCMIWLIMYIRKLMCDALLCSTWKEMP